MATGLNRFHPVAADCAAQAYTIGIFYERFNLSAVTEFLAIVKYPFVGLCFVSERAMNQRIAIWTALMSIHIALGILALSFANDFLGAAIGNSLYVPLWACHKLGLQVFSFENSFIPDITGFGWIIVILFWSATYWVVANVLTAFFRH